jgi:glycosyltransferase involved in cell wall biosynthesis
MSQPQQRYSVVWSAPFDMSGYGAAARGYVKTLDEFGVRVRVEDRSASRGLAGKGTDDGMNRLLGRLKMNPDVPPDAPRVQHQNPGAFEVPRTGPRRRNVGFTVFEMLSIPPPWAAKCGLMDEVWTPSEYSRQAFLAGGVAEGKVHVIPHCVDAKFRPGDRRWPIDNLRGFNFLSLFDFTGRKGWRELLQAYWRAFRRSDDVSLTLKCYFGSFGEGDQADIARRVEGWRAECGFRRQDTAPVLFYGFDIPHGLLPPFYCTFDAYVMLSREGFGLPFAEAMSCGLPAIGPAVGGNREFMSEGNSFLVERVGTEPIDEELVARTPAFRGLEWPTYSVEGLGHWMKYVYDHPQEAKARAAKGREDVRRLLSYDRIARMIVGRLASEAEVHA